MVFDEKYDPINVLYGEDAYFQAFLGTDIYALKVDSLYASNGKLSIKVTVPPNGSAMGAYAGGVLTAVESRDFADFNALTFKARTDTIARIILDVAGFGNDNTGTSLFEAGRSSITLTPEWTTVVIPIPAPSKLISERGLFTFAEGWEDPYVLGYDIWFDEIKFAKLDNITNVIPRMPTTNTDQQYFVGATVTLTGTRTRFEVDEEVFWVDHSPSYFDYESTDPSVTNVTRNGTIEIVGVGRDTITATLEGVDALGSVTVTGHLPPAVAAASPTHPAENVISLFSDVYQDVNVDTWNADWGQPTQVEDYLVAGDNTKMYSSLTWAGIEFLNPMIDANEMTHFHLDVYAPAGTNFKVKLVSFPPDLTRGINGRELTFNADTTPAFNPGSWISLDILLADLQPLGDWDWAHIGQLVPSTSDAKLVLVDNIYFYK